MAEQQEEMSMNEILSSIKNILVENDEPKTSASAGFMPPAPKSADEVVQVVSDEPVFPESFNMEDIDLTLTPEDTDILELSEDMAVVADMDRMPDVTLPAVDDLNPENGLPDIDLTPEIVDDKGDDAPEPEEVAVGFDELLQRHDTEDERAEDNEAVDVDSEPYYENVEASADLLPELPEPIVELPAAETVEKVEENAEKPETLADAAVEAGTVSEAVWGAGLQSETEVVENAVDAMILPESSESFSVPEQLTSTREDFSEEQKISEKAVAEEAAIVNVAAVDEDVADVSANIINNFAKLFAKKEQPEAEPVAAAAKIMPVSSNVPLGNASQTLEDMLKSTIEGLVAGWVSEARNNLDLQDITAKEVARQTKIWLDSNLPALVEKVVKKEIERVMAKVGQS